MTDQEFLATYYREAAFVGWLNQYQLRGVTAQSVARYYSVYQRHLLCRELKCEECAGLSVSWTSEHEIQTGTCPQRTCQMKIKRVAEAAGAAFKRQFEMPPVFADRALSSLTKIRPSAMEEIRSYIASYPKGRPPGLYLYSAERRIGRTTVMWCILNELVNGHKIYNNAIMTTSAMFAERVVADSWADGHPFFQQAVTCDVLMLDDFGSEKYTEGYADRLAAILEERYWHARPVIVSSTRDFAEWAWPDGREPGVFSKLQSSARFIRLDDAEIAQIV